MFNFGPSMGMMRRMFPGQGSQAPMPGEGMPMPISIGSGEGMPPMPPPDMPIDVGGGVKFPGMELPIQGGPRMPRIIDGPMPTFPGMGGGMQPPMPQQPPPMQGGGFFGKVKGAAQRVAQGMQGKSQPQPKGFMGRFKNMSAAAAPEAAKLLTGRQRGY